MSTLLTQDGKLSATLELRDGTRGITFSGELWTIEPSGSWHVARFVERTVYESHSAGHLSSEELATIAQMLEAKNFFALPAQIGSPSQSRREVTIRFGQQQSTLILAPGQLLTEKAAPPSKDQQAAEWKDFIDIVQTIQNLLHAAEPH